MNRNLEGKIFDLDFNLLSEVGFESVILYTRHCGLGQREGQCSSLFLCTKESFKTLERMQVNITEGRRGRIGFKERHIQADRRCFFLGHSKERGKVRKKNTNERNKVAKKKNAERGSNEIGET